MSTSDATDQHPHEHGHESEHSEAPAFDRDFWQGHWGDGDAAEAVPANPHLDRETSGLPRGTALDAGCGAGAEAILLAQHGWAVTAADISSAALAQAKRNASKADAADRIEWLEADLSTLEPGRQWDLVTTHYAHPSIPQLDFYRRIAGWVAPGGTLLIVAHASGHSHDAPAGQPADTQRTSDDIAGLFSDPEWHVDSAYEESRSVGAGRPPLHDTVVRVSRR